jgi:hypothetical protein
LSAAFRGLCLIIEGEHSQRRGLQKSEKLKINAPDLKLTGHTKDAQFALATSSFSPSVVGGGEDTDASSGTSATTTVSWR